MRLRFLRNLTLKQRVFGFMAVLGLIPIFCLAITAWSIEKAKELKAVQARSGLGALRLAQINAEIYATVMDSRGIYMSTTWQEAAPFAKGMEIHIARLLEIAQAWERDALPTERDRISKLSFGIAHFAQLRRQIIQTASGGDLTGARKLGDNDQNRSSRKALNELVDDLKRAYEEHERKVAILEKEISQINIALLAAIVVVSLLVGAVGTYLVHRTVILLFNRMRIVMIELASGNLDVEFVGVDRSDEIGDFARSFAAFKNDARTNRRMQEEAAAHQALIEAERKQAAAIQATIQAHQAEAIQALTQGLHSLAKGDLTSSLDRQLAPEFQALQADFNATVQKLRSAMAQVSANSNLIASGSQEITLSADDLSRRTEQQAASLEETAAALDQITATVKKTAEGASHALNLVSTTRRNAEQGAAVVRNAVVSMNGIEKSSKEIGQIIGVIDEIAFQTNLLALNAGVEAARAGDAGRGFAVVASEVRGLAQRSAQAAKEIKQLIARSSEQVIEGVALVRRSGQSLEGIAAQVNDVNKVISDIANGAKEQASGIEEVSVAINQMDQITQQNAAMVEETTAASHSLAEKSRELVDLVSSFALENRECSRKAA